MNDVVEIGKRGWRTRKDPFEKDWDEIAQLLSDLPELQVRTIFDFLQEKHPGRYADGQLRTLERRVCSWRALHGEDQEVFFAQEQEPGKYLQLDWMDGSSLGVEINGGCFNHLLCHSVLPFSGWEWARVCFSESLLSLRLGLQDGLFALGGVPRRLQVDNSSAATRQLQRGGSAREFTAGFEALARHFKMKPRKIAVGCPNQNGSVEKGHDLLRRRLDQLLMLRGSRRFESQTAYEGFVKEAVTRANKLRATKLAEERQHFRALPPTKLPVFEEEVRRVGSGSTVRVRRRTYSVPTRLVGRLVHCRVHLDRIELFVDQTKVHEMPRVHQTGGTAGVRWQDLIGSMASKPGALENYRYRDAFFPHPVCNEVYRKLCGSLGRWQGRLEYLQILQHCRDLDDGVLAARLQALAEVHEVVRLDMLCEAPGAWPEGTKLPPLNPDLSGYDRFCEEVDHGE